MASPKPASAAARPVAGIAVRAIPGARPARPTPPAVQPTADATLQQGQRQRRGESGRRGRARQRQRPQQGGGRHPEDLQARGRRRVQLRLLEGGRDGEDSPSADGRDDHERAAHHVVLRDGPVAGVAHVASRIPGHAAVIAHHPQPARRNGDAEPLLRRRVAWVEIGLLTERHAVDGDLALPVAAGHVVAGYPDDALDVVVNSRRGAEQPGDRVPQPAEQRRGPSGHRIPGGVAVKYDDVAAMDRAEIIDQLVDQDLVADVERVLHRRRRNEERLDDKTLDEQGQHQGEYQQDGQLHPPRHARPLTPAAPLCFGDRIAAGPGLSGYRTPVAIGVSRHDPGPIPGRPTSERLADTAGPWRPGLAVEAHRFGTRSSAITWRAAMMLTSELARARISVACGQLLAPRVPVVIHRIEPIAGFCQRRCRCGAAADGWCPAPRFLLSSGSTRLLLRGRLATLPDPGTLAAQRPEVVQLGPAYPAPANDLDLVDGRAVHGKGPLHPYAVADLADGEGLPGPAALAPDHHALEDLDPGPASLDDPDVHLQRVSRPELRDVRANLVLLQVGDGGMHGWRFLSSPRARA